LTQIRVHELASELNVSTQEVLAILSEVGQKVRGPSTVIGVSAAAKIRARLRSERAGQQAAAVPRSTSSARTSISTTTVVDEPPGAVRSASTVAANNLAQSLFLPPVAPPTPAAAPPTVGAFANPFAVATATKSAPNRPIAAMPSEPPATHPVRGVVNRVAPVLAEPVVEPEPNYDEVWQARGINAADRESWERAGLHPAEAAMADRCNSAGIDPADLSQKLSGRTALQRLRDGEASTSVWARLREAEQQPRRVGTKLTGRFQLN